MKKIDFYRLGWILIIFILVAEHSFAGNVDTNEELEKFSASKIYVYDDVNEQWNLLKDIRYFFTDMGRVDSTEVFSPTIPGLKLNDEIHIHSYDELGRTDSILILRDGRKETLYEYSYFNDTELLTESKTSAFPDLVTPFLVEHYQWRYNEEGNLILYEEVKPAGYQKGDSIVYEYNNQGKESLITHYRYEPISDMRIPYFLSTFNYNNDKLESIDIDFMPLGGEEWIEYQRVVDIEEPTSAATKSADNLKSVDVITPYTAQIIYKYYSYVIEQLIGSTWTPILILAIINNSDGSKTTVREFIDSNPKRKVEYTPDNDTQVQVVQSLNDKHQKAYNQGGLSDGFFTSIADVFYFGVFNTFTADTDNYDFREGVRYSKSDAQINGENEIQTKSTSVQRILILTNEIYTEETGEWRNFMKQEFYYEGNLTDVSNNTLEDRISVFPNPTTGKFHIQQSNANGPITIDIFNSVGQQIYSEKTEPLSNNLSWTKNMEGYDKGLYFIRINTGNTTFTKKLIVN